MAQGFLDGIIRFSLTHRLLTMVLAGLVLALGGMVITNLSIDVFPDLDRPRVVVMTEAPGMAPEEVETLITFPIETSLNGANGVQAIRTSSGVGVSVVYVEFDWNTDIYTDRQIVHERLTLASDQLPSGIKPQLAPISSIMGQIMIVGLYRNTPRNEATENNTTTENEGAAGRNNLSPDSAISSTEIVAPTTDMQLRTLADWTIRRRLLAIPGVSQVFVMGGERKQFQVLVRPDLLLQHDISLDEVRTALLDSNQNTTGGYLDEQGPHELLVRAIGRVTSVAELENVVVKYRDGRPVLLRQLATITEGAQVKRGDSSAYVANEKQVVAEGGPAVVLTINKQPDADTRDVTDRITAAFQDIAENLPADVSIETELYRQKRFIDMAINNVIEALRDGSILVVAVLFVFLLNFRTTVVTLTAIPLSIAVTGLVFWWLDLSINIMTLGGLAVAIGELVDDAIVDVENIYRRLRENRQAEQPQSPLRVVFRASCEIRNSIVYGTMIVVLVFLPLFALSGVEGRLFRPLGFAYIISIVSSLLVSLTVTPVLSFWLLKGDRLNETLVQDRRRAIRDPVFLRLLKHLCGVAIRFSLAVPGVLLTVAALVFVFCLVAINALERGFLPAFNEGSAQVNVVLPPGTSLARSTEIAERVQKQLHRIAGIEMSVRRTGRAELDEHAAGVNVSEIIASFDPQAGRSRNAIMADIRAILSEIPGAMTGVEQPIQHLISHMLSGVKAQVAIKVYGDELTVLRETAQQISAVIRETKGIEDLQVEPQLMIPQLRIEVDGDRLSELGLTRGSVTQVIETAMQGEVVSRVLEGQRTFDLLLRFPELFREDLQAIERLAIDLPGGGRTMLGSVAKIYRAGGPNTINREQVRRRIVLQCNTSPERGLVDFVEEIKQQVEPIKATLPQDYFIEFGGQFESQQAASRRIAIVFSLALVLVFLVLYTMFRSVNLALQVLIALPMAFIGGVAALYLTGQLLTVAALVGFISLCGIAARNGILLINHYLHLVRTEGEDWTRAMIVRAGQERLAPVLMTAITSGIGLLPLAIAAGESGKEILYPIATVIVGGLISSTLLEFFVRPALFWKFGMAAAQRITSLERDEEHLVESPVATDRPST